MMHLITMPVLTGGHLGGWRYPDAWTDTVMNFQKVLEYAKMCERAKFDLIFFADGHSVRHMDKPELFSALTPSDRPAGFEPVTLLTAIAQHTSRIGLVATANTTYEEPYLVARKFGSLDHLSRGRGGWNVVTGSTPGDSVNFGMPEHPPKTERYERAEEFVEICKGLWDSWADDAFPQDKTTGRYLDPTRVHTLNYKGKHLTVQGPLNMLRPPQGYPLLLSAGASDGGRELAAKHIDAMFATMNDKQQGIDMMNNIKGRMGKYGRRPDELKILPGTSVYVAETRDQAKEMYDQLNSLITPSLGIEFLQKFVKMDLSKYPLDGPMPEIVGEVNGVNAHRKSIGEMAKRENLTIRQTYERVVPSYGNASHIGNVKDVADSLEDWYTSGACDGFMIDGPYMPGGFEKIVDLLVPELQRRGLFRKEYEGNTLRDIMGLPTPRNQFWDTAARNAAE